MKNFRKTLFATLFTCTASVSAIETSFAEYYVSAFDHGKATELLIEKDLTGARKKLPGIATTNIDYADSNNLCVSQILAAEFDAAIDSCETALNNVPKRSPFSIRKEKSHILTNLAVAKALKGDKEGALADTIASLALDKSNKNSSKNYDRLTSYQFTD